MFVNPEKGSVSIGKALYPSYYKFEVNEGLTAFTGPNQVNQNNLMVLYSGNKGTARYGQGYRHYTGFSHALYPSGEEYGIINTFEYNAVTGSGIGKHLLIQNTNEGNLGVGIFTTAPPAKLSVNGNTYLTGGLSLGSTDFSHFTNYKLVVNGKILAKGLKVQTSGWADFVFEEDYKLMSLQQVEEYIKKYKHLPNVPSATEVLSNGMDVAEMNKILLQKIEELTLNTIELSKKLNALEQELNKMKGQ